MKKIMILCVFLMSGLQAHGFVMSEMTVIGQTEVKSSTVDMWDKKKSAVKNAKTKMTFMLLRRILSKEMSAEDRKAVKKNIIPYADRYILRQKVLNHGLERNDEYSSYQARVKFSYSIDSFKKLLKNKNVLFHSIKSPKVAAFIKVLDLSNVEIHTWWTTSKNKMHPSLTLIHSKLSQALKEEGYELVPMRSYQNSEQSLKDMATRAGAHYYVSGEVKVKNYGAKVNLTEGNFYFHETASQRLVSKLDIIDFKEKLEKEATERNVATTNSVSKPKDIVKDSFKEAVRVMSSIRDAENITRGLTEIELEGVRNPVHLKEIKKQLVESFNSKISHVVERKMERGVVTLYARTSLPTVVLLNSMKSKFSIDEGFLKDNGKGIFIKLQN